MPHTTLTQAVTVLRRLRRPALAGAVLAVLATTLVAAPSHAGPPVVGGPPPGGGNPTVQLLNFPYNLDEVCLSPAGGGSALNNPIVQYYCDADPARLWEILNRTDGTVDLYNESSHLCLSPAGGSTAPGTPIVQYRCDTDPARGWTLVPTGDEAGRVQFKNEHSGLCISYGTLRATNAPVIQAACDNTAATAWFVSDSDSFVEVRTAWWCLDRSGYDVNDTIVLGGCTSYRVSMDITGWYIIQDTYLHLCLSPAGGSAAPNAAIVQYYCDADPARHWLVVPMGGGTYQIMNQLSGLCLSPAGGATTRGTTIVQYTCDGDPSRLWNMFGGPLKL